MEEIKCAVYTRKSTDEGLEKEFNTLEAQREAGENFVKSQKTKGFYANNNAYIMPQNIEPSYEVSGYGNLFSNIKITEISRPEATIINRKDWQVGEEHELELAFDDVDVNVKCVVTSVKEGVATVKFIDLPASVANKLTYHYMKTAAN